MVRWRRLLPDLQSRLGDEPYVPPVWDAIAVVSALAFFYGQIGAGIIVLTVGAAGACRAMLMADWSMPPATVYWPRGHPRRSETGGPPKADPTVTMVELILVFGLLLVAVPIVIAALTPWRLRWPLLVLRWTSPFVVTLIQFQDARPGRDALVLAVLLWLRWFALPRLVPHFPSVHAWLGGRPRPLPPLRPQAEGGRSSAAAEETPAAK